MYTRYVKRIVDVVLALALIIFCAWLMMLIILLYILTSHYPIFFKQKRIGKNGKVFNLFKFRTLKDHGATLEQRRFWLGDALRYSSIDELPQVINILKGEMSFIGPRPLPIEYFSLYSDEQHKRHIVLPGITGWAQVNGRHKISWDMKFILDLYYVQNISLILDLKILIKTLILVLSFKKDISLQESKFTGNRNE